MINEGRPIKISKIATECSDLLSKATISQTIPLVDRTALADLRYRYMVWCGNVGAFARETASLEHRLEDEEDIAYPLFLILSRLARCIQDILDPPIREESDSDDTENLDALSTTISDSENGEESERVPEALAADGNVKVSEREQRLSFSSSESSLDLGLSSDEEDASEDQTSNKDETTKPQSLWFSNIIRMRRSGLALQNSEPSPIGKAESMVDHLYEFASVLRKPVSSTEASRVQNFLHKFADNVDIKQALDHENLKRTAIFWTKGENCTESKRPQVPEVLVERLVDSILQRRSKLVYREHHEKNLRSGASILPEIVTPSATPAIVVQLDTTLSHQSEHHSNEQEVGTLASNRNLEDTGAELRRARSPNQHPSVVTDSSSVNRLRFKTYCGRSAARSRVSPSTAERHNQLNIPEPPKPVKDAFETECPYCFKFLKKEEMREPYWRRHVLKDIGAYICLFKNCQTPQRPFSTPEEWLAHMKGHAVVWCCGVAGHGGEVFDSPGDLQQHIEDHHSNNIPKNQIPYLLKKSEKIIEDPFIQLTVEYDPTYSYEPEKTHKCLFCLDYATNQLQQSAGGTDSGTKESHSGIYQHTLEHLEALALLSLPEKDIPDCVTGFGSDSSKRSLETGEQPSIADSRNLDALSDAKASESSESPDLAAFQTESKEAMRSEELTFIPDLDAEAEEVWSAICSDVDIPPRHQSSESEDDTILLRFSNSPRRRERKRIREFLKRNADDWRLQVQLHLEELRNHALFTLKLPYLRQTKSSYSISKKLVDRLIESILYRRAKLIYRTIDRTPSRMPSITQDAQPQTLQWEETTTTVSQFKDVRIQDVPLEDANLVAESGMVISSGSITCDPHGKLEVPKAPKLQFSKGLDSVECPYCHVFLREEDLGEPQWARHVLQDIEPYICLFPDCRAPDSLYRSPEDWLKHTMRKHGVVWCCELPGHGTEIFSFMKARQLERHIRLCHARTFTETELPSLVRRGKRMMKNPLARLAYQLDSESSSAGLLPLAVTESQQQDLYRCPLCPYAGMGESPTNELYSHVLCHLESLALLSLPETSESFDSSLARASHYYRYRPGLNSGSSVSRVCGVHTGSVLSSELSDSSLHFDSDSETNRPATFETTELEPEAGVDYTSDQDPLSVLDPQPVPLIASGYDLEQYQNLCDQIRMKYKISSVDIVLYRLSRQQATA